MRGEEIFGFTRRRCSALERTWAQGQRTDTWSLKSPLLMKQRACLILGSVQNSPGGSWNQLVRMLTCACNLELISSHLQVPGSPCVKWG